MAAEARIRVLARLLGLANGLREWRGKRKALRELAEVDTGERQRLVRDLNMSERDLMTAIGAGTKNIPLLRGMLDALGLDQVRLSREYQQVEWDLVRVCTLCPNKRRCRRELEASTAGVNFREFCLNAMTLSALSVDLSSSTQRSEGSERNWRKQHLPLGTCQ